MSTVDPYSVWRTSTEPRFNRASRRAPAYLTPPQAQRWERIIQARQLYVGDHFDYFVTQARTQWEYPEVVVCGKTVRRMVPFNLLKRIANSSAALLFGSEPIIKTANEIQSSKLRDFAARTDLHALLTETEIESSSLGEAVLEACIFDGEVYLVLVPAEQIHPVGSLRPDRQYSAYVRYAEAEVGTDSKRITLILRTTYREGSIERTLFQDEVRAGREVMLAEWPAFKESGRVPDEITKTGLDVNTIVWVPNLLFNGHAVSDFDGLIEHQDTLNAKSTGMAAVIDRHQAPKLVAPRAAADENGNIRASSDVLYADDPNEWRYLTWDAKLDMAERHFSAVIDAMCVISETSPVLLGIERGNVPDSARGMRLRAMSSTSKAERKATLRRPVLTWALDLVQQLEQTIPGRRYDRPSKVSIEMRDGLPTDQAELSQTVATYRSAGAMSLEDAVGARISDPAARDAEVSRIRAEQAAQTPSVLLGDPSTNQGGTPTRDAATTSDPASTEAA